MLVDYGLSSPGHLHFGNDHGAMQALRFVEHHIDQLRNDYGVQQIELVVPTHINDDHICGIPFLQRKFGTQCWALDCVAEVIANPSVWASTPCCYHKPIKVQRVLRDEETFHWRGFDFQIHYAPGQTEFHSMILAQIDGRRVLFSGDNVARCNPGIGGIDRDIPVQLTVMRNSFQLEMHRRCANVLRATRPDLLCPGHGPLIEMSQSEIAEYAGYVQRKEAAFRDVVSEPANHFIDLFWVRMLPYVSETSTGSEVTYTVRIRNNLNRSAVYEARLLPAFCWRPKPEVQSITLAPGQQGEIYLRATAPSSADPARRVLLAEIFVDGVPQGPICEALVTTSARATS
ncbi:MBL fold metallo-hydrolase [Mesorhizobium sp. M0968]